ncbi:MAG: hypothetical protein AB2721_02665, partial [Candidatus Thiodiazotropha sp.]
QEARIKETNINRINLFVILLMLMVSLLCLTGDYIAGSYYRVMPPALNIVLCRLMFYICSLESLIAWSDPSHGKKRTSP